MKKKTCKSAIHGGRFHTSRFLAIGTVLAALLVMLPPTAKAQAIADQVLHYKLDAGTGGTAFDTSGNGHDANLVNGPAWIPGQFGNALSFNGTGSHVLSAYTTNLPQWTVAVWTRSPAAPANGPASGPVHREKNFAFSWNHPSSAFRGTVALRVAGTWHAASFGALAANTWYHLAATYDGETLKAYRDGVLIAANAAPSGNPDAESAPLTLGKAATAPQFFRGDVDDVQVFGQAVSDAEIQSLMISGSDFTPPQISGVAANSSASSATITWTTDEPSDSGVNYGTTTGLGQNVADTAFSPNHSVTLTGLNPSTQYFFEVTSQDPSGNLATDDNGGALYAFTTQAAGTTAPAEVRYELNEGVGAVAFDSSGNGRDATLVNGPTWIPGQSGTALSFDGANNYVQSGFETNLPQWTVAAWTRSPTGPTAGPASGPVHREKNFAFSWNHPSSAFRGTVALRVAGTWHAASFGALAANTWYHLAATYDGETLKAYRDGVLIAANAAPSGNPDAESAPLTLGKNAIAPRYFSGDVDDVQVFGQVLTEAEIVDLMVVEPDFTPPQIAGVSAAPAATSATISWTTDEPSDSIVNYGTTTALGLNVAEGAFPRNHSVTLTGLNPSTQYFFEVTSQDPSGNLAMDDNGGALYTFTTTAVPPAPVIDNVQISSVTDTSATIVWSTDFPADSTVDYGPDESLGLSVSDPSDVTSHSVTLTSLERGTEYFFTVSSAGEGGTTVADNGGVPYSFTTTDIVAFSNIVVSDITATSATVRWQTNLQTHASVARNIEPTFDCPFITFNPQSDTHYCTVWNQLPKSTPEIRLAELIPNTTYHFQVRGALDDGGQVFDAVAPFTFTTLASVGAPVDVQINASSDDAHSDPFEYNDTAFEIAAGLPAEIPVTGGWRWTGLNIPAGSIITEAWVELNQNDFGTGFVSLLSFQDSSSPATFGPSSAPHDRWADRTNFEIEWPWPHTDQPGSWIRTSSLVAGVQELVDRYGAIDALVLLEQGGDQAFHSHRWSSYDLATSLGGRLHIQYIDPNDLTPPQISNVAVATSATAATISWTTDEPSDSLVNYGPNAALGLTASKPNFRTEHSVTLTGLAPSTQYLFEVTSTDSNGNRAIDDNLGQLHSFTTIESPVFSRDLVLHYRFDEGSGTVAFDSSTSGQDATLINGPVWVPGQVGTGALSFDGADSYVETGFATDLPQWTVALWVESPNAPRARASNGPVQREDNFVIVWDDPDLNFRRAAALSVGGIWYPVSFGDLAANTWYHLAATYDGETLKAYRDGVLTDINEDPSGPPDAESATLRIGRNAVTSHFFEGQVDDVQVYGRALAEFEIYELQQ